MDCNKLPNLLWLENKMCLEFCLVRVTWPVMTVHRIFSEIKQDSY